MAWILMLIQLMVTLVVGVYFYTQLKRQKQTAQPQGRESAREMEQLKRMRAVKLSRPLCEHVRPTAFSHIIGQEDGIKSLRAILCGANPQHVIIYGPPGVGKTCAARLVLECAKRSPGTPFAQNAPFIEMDATCVRFDERAIADPLIGSVHDPIYQGAGQLGAMGVPQPKPGAVSRAHGGVLFLDEIGELHPIQMNKLLKVLEDRKVMFESAYYNPDDHGVPRYIHDIFKNGMPADFRLVGATTRSPEEISPALRSRCMEVFFRPLTGGEVTKIAFDAASRAGYDMSQETAREAGRFAQCGRDAVNMVQMAAGLAQLESRKRIERADIEWVVLSGKYAARPSPLASREDRVGGVHALGVLAGRQGAVMPLEAVTRRGCGRVYVTGIVEEEEMGGGGHTLRRTSTARASSQNVQTLLQNLEYLPPDRDVHINFPGGMPVDGPSAGLAMALAAVSALSGQALRGDTAVTGEIGVQGRVLPVGGVPDKVEAAWQAGLSRVLVPRDNMLSRFADAPIEIIPVDTLSQALTLMNAQEAQTALPDAAALPVPLAAACKSVHNPI